VLFTGIGLIFLTSGHSIMLLPAQPPALWIFRQPTPLAEVNKLPECFRKGSGIQELLNPSHGE
jgi:hypothetical protein